MGVQRVFTKLILVVLLGAGLRLWGITQYPPALNWDEVSHAYNAWSLIKTGQDQWGSQLPILNFRAYGDYPTTLNLYGTVPAIAIFGPTDFAARFPHALVGVLSVILAFGAGYFWKRNWQQGILMAFLVAVEPWTMFTSRQVLQSNWTVFLVLAFLLFFLHSRRLWAILILFVTLFSYHNARIYVPLTCVVLLVAWRDKTSRLFTGVVLVASILILLSPASRARSGMVGILDAGAIATIEGARNNSTLPVALRRWAYNRPVYVARKVLVNYLDYFSPGFLFLHGGTQYQFSIPKTGLLTILDAPFFYLGLVLMAVQYPLLAILFFLAPLPAAITQDRFTVVRSTIMIPFVMLAISIGWGTIKRRGFLGLYAVVGLLLLGSYYRSYFSDYPKNYSQSWQYGYQQAVDFINERQDKYEQIIVTKRYGEPHEYVLWYGKINPRRYLQDLQLGKVNWNYHDNWYWIDGYDKFTFVNDWEMKAFVDMLPKTGKYLVVSSPDNIITGEVLTTINFLDNTPAFIVSSL